MGAMHRCDGEPLPWERQLPSPKPDVETEHPGVAQSGRGDAVIVTDNSGTVIFVNSDAELLTGWKATEAVGEPLGDVFIFIDEHTGCLDDDFIFNTLHKGITNQTRSARLVTKEGALRVVERSVSPIRTADEHLAGAVLVIRDVTEDIADRKRADEIKKRFVAIVESSDDAIVSKSLDGTILSWNPGAERLFGYSADEAVGRPITMIIPHELHHEEVSILERLGRGEHIEHYETVRVSKDGQRIDISLTISPIRNGDGRVVAASKIARDITGRKRVEAALRDSEERYRRLVGLLPVAVYTCEAPSGVITFHNERAAKLWGRTPNRGDTDERFCGSFRLLRPDGTLLPHDQTPMAFALRDGRKFRNEDVIIERPDGIRICVIVNIDPVRDSNGRVIGAISAFQDTTELNYAQEALRQSEERFRTMTNVTPALIWTAAPDGTITWSSDRWYEFTGTSREDDSSDWLQALHPDDLERCLLKWNRSLTEGCEYEIEVRYRSHNGEYRWFLTRATPIRNENQVIVEWYGSSTDITDHKQLENSLRFLAEASKALSSLVDYKSTLRQVAEFAVPDFADWCTVDVLDSNETLQHLVVEHVDPAKVKLVEEFHRRYPPDLHHPRGVTKVLRTGQPELVCEITEAMLVEASRDDEYLNSLRVFGLKSYMCVPLAIKGKILGAITFVSAQSERRYTATDLAVAEDLAHRAAVAIENARLYQEVQAADRRKDEFLAMLAHELRNPLAPIRSGLDLLAMEDGRDDETIRLMQAQTEHLIRLVDDLLDVSRIMQGKIELRREPVELSALISRSVEAIRGQIENREQSLAVSVPEQSLWLNADPVRLVQIVENLLNNASKYTDAGGQIELSVQSQGDQALVDVKDNGIGIEPELLSRIFQPFTQSSRSLDRAQGGLGIGLTLAQQLVELHGGTISAHSDGPGLGSTFSLRLPVVHFETKPKQPHEQPAISQGRRILVVDDNAGALRMLCMLLSKLGDHQIESTYDGPTALVKIKEMHPEIVLLDIGLPKLDGYQVAKTIREMHEFDDVFLVALTGYGQDEDRNKSKAAGFDMHLVKPVEVSLLQQLLSEIPPRSPQ